MVLDKVVSSAYIIKSDFLVDSEKSFIQEYILVARQLLKVKFQSCFLSFPCIVSYFLSNFQIVSELNLPVHNSLAYVI